MILFPDPYGSLVAATGKVAPSVGLATLGAFRLPTDPLFTATLTLNNIMGGSRYRVTRHDTGAQVAAGLVAGTVLTDEVIAGVSCFANPMQVDITVRNASGTPAYKVFDTSAFMVKSGTSAYILQQADE